ncbi:hypothetical protein ACFYN0_00930 [Streptomyces sp. NPDC006704]|uniref:hypothetical protein n=1 Tax=Streptomyces sp. NPDC006704 TaxID=3364760 RepID=UPI0036C9C3FD
MPANSLAEHAAQLRSTLLSFLRSPVSREFYRDCLDAGAEFTMPAAWTTLPHARQAEQLVQAEDRRVAGGVTFGLDAAVTQAVTGVAADRTHPLAFTEDVLPAPSGMLVTEVPLHELDGVEVVAATWGPPMTGFGPGVHLTWWSVAKDPHRSAATRAGRPVPVIRDFDLHLPFAPFMDARLWLPEVPPNYEYSALPLRAVVAAWYALSTGAADLSEQRPEPATSRALAAQKAKRRSVQTAAGESVEAVRRALLAGTAKNAARVKEEHPGELGGLTMGSEPRMPHAETGTEPVADFGDELEAAAAWEMAGVYLGEAEFLQRLELEVTQLYPGLFEALEELRARHFGEWPAWCWMPSAKIAGWLVTQHQVPLDQAIWDASRIAALGAWRSGGRHLVLVDQWLASQAGTSVPTELPALMPTPGIGLQIPVGEQPRHVIAYMGVHDGPDGDVVPELILIDDEADPARSFRQLSKRNLFLTGRTLTDAVRTTEQYYDRVAIAEGRPPAPNDEDLYAEYAKFLGFFTGLLTAVCDPADGLRRDESGAMATGGSWRSWPPQPTDGLTMMMWFRGSPDSN